MHNVQHLKHKKTQTFYPSTDSSSAVYLSNFSHGSPSSGVHFNSHGSKFIRPSFSLTTHTSHKLHQTFSLLPSLSRATQEHHPPLSLTFHT
ncbi:hypothetical protein Hanom_Chr16g01429371 [Helianthus anomalus]